MDRIIRSPVKRGNEADRQHLRLFAVSHLCGPLIGLALGAFLFVLGFPIDVRLKGFGILICLFWAYPVALSIGVTYRLLSLASLQHLTLVILWASYGYGGLTSPFLLWLAIVPLLAFLYSAPRVRLWLILLAILGLDTGLFVAFTVFVEPSPSVEPHKLHALALVSLLSATAYVCMLASFLGRALSSRNELVQVVARYRAAAVVLDRRNTELRRVRAARAASLVRLAQGCQAPIVEILQICQQVVENAPANRRASLASDLLSIKAATRRLADHIEEVKRHRIDVARQPPEMPK